ncbi:MAG: hypothetical protein KKB39_03635 [Nanoarchaeota archaeon]|nr:hypothetical protein [Nanoarchaeota archaeon]
MKKLDFKYTEKVDAISKATKLIELCKLQSFKPEELTRIMSRIDNVKRGYIKSELTKKEQNIFEKITEYDISIRQARDWFKALCLRPRLQEKIKQRKLPLKAAIKINNEILFKSRLTQEKILEEIKEAFEELDDINEA